MLLILAAVPSFGNNEGQFTKNNPLVIVEKNNFPPYSFVDGKGAAKGLNVDLVKEMMDRLEIPYELRFATWKEIKAGISSGYVNIAPMIYNPDTDSTFKFSATYLLLKFRVVYRKKDPPINTIRDLRDKVIAVEDESATENMANSFSHTGNIVFVDNLRRAIILLSQGEYDAVLCDEQSIKHIIRENRIKNLVISDIGLPDQDYSFAGTDTSLVKRLNSELSNLKDSGELDKIQKKWVNSENGKYDIPHKANYTSFMLGILISIFVLATIFLIIKVNSSREKLRKENKKLQLAVKAGQVTVWVYDIAKDKFTNIEGEPFLKGMGRQEAMHITHPDDRRLQKELLLDIMMGKKERGELVIRISPKNDGNYIYHWEDVVASKSRNGKVTTIVGTTKDITEKVKQQNEINELYLKYKTVFTEVSVGCVFFDSEGTLIDINDKACNIFGYADKKNLIGKTDIYENPYFNGYFKGQHSAPHYEIMEINADPSMQFFPISGKRFWECSFTPHYDTNNKISGYIVCINDVTNLIQTQKNLEAEKDKAVKETKAKLEFIANVSHEVRTPLNAITGFSNLIMKTSDPQEKKEYAEIIEDNSELLDRLINDVLDLTKLDYGTMKFNAKKTDVSHMFGELCTALKRDIKNEDILFIVDNPYDSCNVYVDGDRLAQIITNFVTNAVKHTKTGHVKVGYSYLEGGIKTYVEDTGPGIPEGNKEKIFQRFTRLDDSVPGNGLGLSICKAITDACGGKIGFESKVGAGTTFWAWIPAPRA
ncbi:MAG: transporter substrate-binding domain-containing protein [Bacteroidales bacterium]|jgi:PAS domain S-box-containing protein|nr:transporter substrate-binding domain-containing protein [Bacteroidales bacterium]MCI2145389.1 transporter substrate-binding domain-containing protein [Bacteroidales bacterium]